MVTRRRRAMRFGASLLALLVASACSGPGPDRGPTDPDHPLVQAWGVGPEPDSSVELQPDVVIVEGGARSIRGVADGGLTWRIDPGARGADRLEVGKIMFVTGYSVGRVLKLRRTEGDLVVTVGPVTLVDVIREGTFTGSDVPISAARERPPVDRMVGGRTESPAAGGASVKPAAYRLLPATPSAAGQRATGHGTPFCCKDGAGARFGYAAGGTKFYGQVGLRFKAPRANFFIEIKHGSLRRAEVSITGGYGAYLDFAAATSDGVNQTIDIPTPGDWAVIVASIGKIPIGLHISQAVILKTAFGSKTGELHAHADYDLATTVGFQYADGKFSPVNRNKFVRHTSVIQSMGSIAPGVMGVLVKHVAQLSIGFNAYLLDAGLHLDVETTFGVTAGAGAGAVALAGSHFVQCRGAGLGVYANFSVGFRILGVVADIVNRFLALLDVKPIPIRIGPPPLRVPIFADTDVDPKDTVLCGQPGVLGGSTQDDPQHRDGTSASLNGVPDPKPPQPARKPDEKDTHKQL